MTNVERIPFVIATGATGSGSAVSPYPIEGRILEWVAPAGATALARGRPQRSRRPEPSTAAPC